MFPAQSWRRVGQASRTGPGGVGACGRATGGTSVWRAPCPSQAAAARVLGIRPRSSRKPLPGACGLSRGDNFCSHFRLAYLFYYFGSLDKYLSEIGFFLVLASDFSSTHEIQILGKRSRSVNESVYGHVSLLPRLSSRLRYALTEMGDSHWKS